jgi:hypothetical protein
MKYPYIFLMATASILLFHYPSDCLIQKKQTPLPPTCSNNKPNSCNQRFCDNSDCFFSPSALVDNTDINSLCSSRSEKEPDFEQFNLSRSKMLKGEYSSFFFSYVRSLLFLQASVESLNIFSVMNISGIPQESIEHYYGSIANKKLPLNLCRVKIDDEKLGFGIFLKKTAECINKDSFIGFYTGRIEATHLDYRDRENRYLFLITRLVSPSLSENNNSGNEIIYFVINAKDEGNFTRYINHSEDCNVKAQLVVDDIGNIEIGFFASKTIEPGSQLLIDYGKSYWELESRTLIPINPETYVIDAEEQINNCNTCEEKR